MNQKYTFPRIDPVVTQTVRLDDIFMTHKPQALQGIQNSLEELKKSSTRQTSK